MLVLRSYFAFRQVVVHPRYVIEDNIIDTTYDWKNYLINFDPSLKYQLFIYCKHIVEKKLEKVIYPSYQYFKIN